MKEWRAAACGTQARTETSQTGVCVCVRHVFISALIVILMMCCRIALNWFLLAVRHFYGNNRGPSFVCSQRKTETGRKKNGKLHESKSKATK